MQHSIPCGKGMNLESKGTVGTSRGTVPVMLEWNPRICVETETRGRKRKKKMLYL